MALTSPQRRIRQLLAEQRKGRGESYVAGGGALKRGRRRPAPIPAHRTRREARDWVDTVRFHEKVQPLGYLAWAAVGKDPGLSPLRIVEECARTRYAQAEIDGLDFDGPAPQVAEISATWHAAVDEAREIVRALAAEQVGRCVLDHEGLLEKGPAISLSQELSAGRVVFQEGRIRGAFRELRSPRATTSTLSALSGCASENDRRGGERRNHLPRTSGRRGRAANESRC